MQTLTLDLKEQLFLKSLLDKVIKVEEANKRASVSSRFTNEKNRRTAVDKLTVLHSIRSKVAP